MPADAPAAMAAREEFRWRPMSQALGVWREMFAAGAGTTRGAQITAAAERYSLMLL